MIRRFASWLASGLRPATPPTRFEDGSPANVATNLSSPGQFKTCKGQVFRLGLDSAPDDEGLRESLWIAFEGVRLRVSLSTPESGANHRVTFCGKDAEGCSEARLGRSLATGEWRVVPGPRELCEVLRRPSLVYS